MYGRKKKLLGSPAAVEFSKNQRKDFQKKYIFPYFRVLAAKALILCKFVGIRDSHDIFYSQ
jgi:hypothetical protein